MLTQAHCAPTPVAQSLNFRDRMAWFHKQSAATGSCADDEVITRGGLQRKLGTMLDTSAMGERMAARENHRAALSRGLWGVSLVPVFKSCRTEVDACGITLTSVPRWGEWLQCYLWSTVCLPSQTQPQRGHLPAHHRGMTNHENNVPIVYWTLSEKALLAYNFIVLNNHFINLSIFKRMQTFANAVAE